VSDLAHSAHRNLHIASVLRRSLESAKPQRGHNKVTTTLGIYAHLFEDNHAAAMVAIFGRPPISVRVSGANPWR
jgi:hypothetical protein